MQTASTQTKYCDNELQEFKHLIEEKIHIARQKLLDLTYTLNSARGDNAAIAGNDGSATYKKEQPNQLAARRKKFKEQLETELTRIQYKTYGICRGNGKLIPAEWLRAVPHTTMSMKAKLKHH